MMEYASHLQSTIIIDPDYEDAACGSATLFLL